MSHAFLSLTSYVVNALWQLPMIGVAAWGLSRCLKRTGPELPHQIWVAALMLATLAPATPIFQQYFGHPSAVGAGIELPPPILAPHAGGPVALTGSHLLLPPTVIYLVSWLYLAVLVFFSLRLFWVIHCTAALLRNARPAAMEPDYVAMWNRSKTRFLVPTASLLRFGDVPGPVTAGFGRPVLLLPATFIEKHSATEFLAAIGHECAHIRRQDFRKNIFYEVVALLTAFHPLAWFIKSQIAQTREMICDRMAAEELLDRRTYGESLLQLATKMPAAMPSAVLHTIGMFDSNILERRIMTLMTSLPRVGRLRRYSLGAAAVLLLSICAAVSGSFTQSVAAQTAADSKKQAAANPDLSCTFYDQAVPSPGTCASDPQDKTKYRCYSNQSPSKSQNQSSCEQKVKRAAEAKK